MATVDFYSQRPSFTPRSGENYILSYRNNVTGFECGTLPLGRAYMCANLAHPNGDMIAKVHMEWNDIPSMLAWMNRSVWRSVPLYWNNAGPYHIHVTAMNDADEVPVRMGCKVRGVKVGREIIGHVVQVNQGYATFAIADNHGVVHQVLRTDVRHYR